jgi:hypothetical protein
MKRNCWKELIESLPTGLTQPQAANRLRRAVGAVRYWIKQLGYKHADGRCIAWTEARKQARRKVSHSLIDWKQTNVAIAKQHGLSRERVRQIRSALKLAKVNGRKRHARV